MDKDIARYSTAKDGFYSSPRSWILGQEASFVNSGIGGHSLVLDGLITNDKFCWIRPLHLSLSWNEAQRQQAAMLSRSRNSLEALEGTVPLEVANEAAVDHQTTTPSHGRRAETMGPSLSTAAACGSSAKSKCRRKRASRSTDPCTAGEDR